MAEVGIFGRRDRVELIRGEILEMSPVGRRHGAFVDNLTRLLVLRLDDRAMVRVQGAVALADDTEPQPDLALLRRGAVPYKDRDAWAEDALLVIEVAERSLAYDRSTKMRLYAEAVSRNTGSWTALRRPSRCTVGPGRRGIATSAW